MIREKLLSYKKIGIITLIAIFFFLVSIFLLKPKKEVDVIQRVEEEKNLKTVSLVKVEVKGAVLNPGVYEAEENERIEDIIQKAGGFLESAETITINLSKKVIDEMVIFIYSKEEIEKMKEEETRQLKTDQTCICPKIENQACMDYVETNYISKENDNFSIEGKVSLNQGIAKDFEKLPGIGSVKANAIVKYREEQGPFQSIEEVQKVNGIGASTYEKIKDFLTL